ncbi:hypothetical protein ACTMU2_31805 [Cupriavidus basilensis]
MERHDGVTLNLAVHNREELLHQLAGNLPTWQSWCDRPKAWIRS